MGRREDGGRSNIRFEGFETVRRCLQAEENGRPRLLESPRCVNTRREFRTYHYPPTRVGFNPSEEPAKVDDHAMDALRYAVSGLKRTRLLAGPMDMYAKLDPKELPTDVLAGTVLPDDLADARQRMHDDDSAWE